MELAVQQVLKDDGLVVFGVFRPVEQGGGAFGDGFFEESQGRGVMFQFSLIPRFEVVPFLGIVREPLAEIVARSDFFEP